MIKKYQRNNEIIFSEEGDTMQLFSPFTGSFFEINILGKVIWEELETWKSFDELVSSIVTVFEVTQGVVELDVKEFIDHLFQRGLILKETLPHD